MPVGCQGVHKLPYFCLIFLDFTSYALIFPNDEILSSLVRIRLPFLIFATPNFTQQFFGFFSFIYESLDLIADNNEAEFIVNLPISCVFVFGFQLLQPLQLYLASKFKFVDGNLIEGRRIVPSQFCKNVSKTVWELIALKLKSRQGRRTYWIASFWRRLSILVFLFFSLHERYIYLFYW